MPAVPSASASSGAATSARRSSSWSRRRPATIAARTGLHLQIAQVAVRNRQHSPRRRPARGVLTSDAHARRHRPRHRPRGRADRRHRARPRADHDGAEPRQAGRHRPTRSCSPTSVPSCSRPPTRRRRPAVRGRGRRRHPARPGAARESLRGEPIRRVLGIVNGTTNFILTKMSEEGADVRRARWPRPSGLGFAERDPTADVEGFDAGAKAAIIASIALRGQGGRRRRATTRASATSPPTTSPSPPRLGYVVKLLGHRRAGCGPGTRSPCACTRRWCRRTHPLASVRESYNAVFVEGGAVGR